MSEPARSRPPAHAGTFYPAAPERLASQVDAALAAVAPRPTPEAIGALVPHAGLMYSGGIAAHVWAVFAADPPDTIVFAGTNHVAAWLRGIAVWPTGTWHHPLGRTAVDEELAALALGLGPPFVADAVAHAREHSIEVHLPFMARAVSRAAIVPMMVHIGSAGAGVAAGTALGELLASERATGRRIALVISSDLAHYPPAEVARRVDRAVLDSMLRLDPLGLAETESRLRSSPAPGLVCGMCGIDAAVFGLAALRAMGATRGELLAEATSADVRGGDPDRTVGYAAVTFV